MPTSIKQGMGPGVTWFSFKSQQQVVVPSTILCVRCVLLVLHPLGGRTQHGIFVCRSNQEADEHVEAAVQHFSQMLLLSRLRTYNDRQHLLKLYEQSWGTPLPCTPTPELCITPERVQLGWACLPRTDMLFGQNAAGMLYCQYVSQYVLMQVPTKR